MLDEIALMQTEAEAAIAAADSEAALEELRVKYLGRNGLVRGQFQKLGSLPKEDRPAVGAALNQLAKGLEERLEARRAELAAADADRALLADAIDITLPGRSHRVGKRHPLLATLDEMVAIFLGLGFRVVEGPEVEDYYHSFTALNYPEYHPAMDEQMTFYCGPDVLLRSQTSTVQIRAMEHMEPPVRIVVPGRCYRRDTVDATHCHTFYQLEGLLVDEGVTFADLKGTLEIFAREMFGERCHVRFRPDFFPFTEPSAEVALSCTLCEGGGCRVCSNTGYLEVGGAGEVDPNVLAGVGYDTDKYTGFAFGVGVERFTMLRHGIDDIRLFYSGDMRFLGQF
ncbi:MAG: phenylalanine--tRNA ligase subunit alpha [Armatimonadetes bacterium]|nr:phenylalanine--tRNA ligase subunit alpha [Armatimonadota bacterium]